MSDNPKSPLNLAQSLTNLNLGNLIQQVRSVGAQPRPTSTSPNAIADTNARALSTPRHVTNVQATLSRTSDVSSKVSVTFKRDPTDYYFSNAQVYVSGYKGNPAPVLVGSGQSPISFALENTGEAVSVTVQAVGNLGPAALSTAPNATLKLDKTPLVTTATTGGNGTGGSSITLQTNEVNNGSQSVLDLHAGSNVTLTDNGSGRVTIDGYRGLLSYSWAGWSWYGGLTGANQTPFNDSITLATGGVSPANNPVKATGTIGGGIQSSTGTTSGSMAGVYSGWGGSSVPGFTLGVLKRAQTRVAVITQNGNARIWIGAYLASRSAPIGALDLNTDTAPNDFVGFRFSNLAADTKWMAVCNKAGVQTVTSTGTSVDGSGAPHVFEFQAASGGTVVNFYIDGSLVATISSSNVPAVGTGLRMLTCIVNTGATNEAIQINGAYWETYS